MLFTWLHAKTKHAENFLKKILKNMKKSVDIDVVSSYNNQCR